MVSGYFQTGSHMPCFFSIRFSCPTWSLGAFSILKWKQKNPDRWPQVNAREGSARNTPQGLVRAMSTIGSEKEDVLLPSES